MATSGFAAGIRDQGVGHGAGLTHHVDVLHLLRARRADPCGQPRGRRGGTRRAARPTSSHSGLKGCDWLGESSDRTSICSPRCGPPRSPNLEGCRSMTAQPASETGRIVVGFDGSESSLDALAWAARQAVLTGQHARGRHDLGVAAELRLGRARPRRFRPRGGRPQGARHRQLPASLARTSRTSRSRRGLINGHPAPDPRRGLQGRRPARRRQPRPR